MQAKHLTYVLSCLLVAILQGQVFAQAMIPTTKSEVSSEARLRHRLDAEASKTFRHDAPGAVVLVMKGNRVLLRRAYGMANIELGVPMQFSHRFHVASVGKQFTAAAILLLQEQAKLNVEDLITNYFQDLPDSWSSIRVKHLLSHTSGIRNLFNDASFREKAFLPHAPHKLLDIAKAQELLGPAGQQFHYASINYTLLAMLVEKQSGQSYAEFIEQKFLRPIGMRDTVFDQVSEPIKGAVSPYQSGPRVAERFDASVGFGGGSFYSTAEDLMKWTRAINAGKVLSVESLKKMRKRFVLETGIDIPYGYGIRPHTLRHQIYLQSNGDIQGFHTETVYFPLSDVFIAVLSNGESLPYGLFPLTKRLAMLANQWNYLEPKPFKVDHAILRALTGVYAAGNDTYQIRFKDAKLWLVIPGGGKWNPLTALSSTEFFYDTNPDFRVKFSRDAGGKLHSQWREVDALDDEIDPVLDWQGPIQ